MPGRRRPVHIPAQFSWERPIIVFVTTCTSDRKRVLARPEAHRLIVAAWKQANEWLVGRYVIMPDHLHFFCAPATETSRALEKWMQYWKALVSSEWLWPPEKPLWQKDHWDRQLRRNESYAQKWEYVRMNPVRHKLAARPEDWPFQGEINTLAWY